MLYRFKQLQKQLPTVHLVAVSACVFILGLTLMLLPSENVEATRGDIPAAPPLIVTTITAEPISTDSTPTPAPNSAKSGTLKKEEQDTPAIIEENWVDYTIGSGDNLTSMFKKAGLTARDVYRVANAAKDSK